MILTLIRLPYINTSKAGNCSSVGTTTISGGTNGYCLYDNSGVLANQSCGYSLLHYPVTANSLAWGAALGLAAIAATLAARFAAGQLAGHSRLLAIGGAFLAAFVTYEGLQYIGAVAALGGAEDYTLPVVARELELSAIAMAGLLALNYAGSLVRSRQAASV